MTDSEGIAQVGSYLSEQEAVRVGASMVGQVIAEATVVLTGPGWVTLGVDFWNAMAGKARRVRLSPTMFDSEATTQAARIIGNYSSAGPFTVVLNIHLGLMFTALAAQAKRIIIPIFAQGCSVEAAAAWHRARSTP